jgi:glyoxylase-like metal-dependent hydrolase (beta-lactamase superfamily II)
MARRQEQEPARSAVTEVAKNVLRIELPIRLPGLGHVNCYAIHDADGAALMDPGLPGPGTWRILQERLKQVGLRVRDVHTVIITHSHPDHFGCAGRFAREAGAKIVAHRRFHFGAYTSWQPEVSVDDLAAHHRHAHGEPDAPDDDDELPEQLQTAIEEAHAILVRARAEGRAPWGGKHRPVAPLLTRLAWRAGHWLGRSFVPRITHPVEHGDMLELAGREWFVVHTPGHTADHFCLHDPAGGVLLAGDHILPTITPHISGISSSPDPLASFFYSLDRVAEIQGVEQVLPSHGHPFSDLAGRVAAIKRHHEDRLAKVRAISRELGPASVQDFSRRLFAPRSWGLLAESETFAHLEHLRLAGQAERRESPDGSLIYVAG